MSRRTTRGALLALALSLACAGAQAQDLLIRNATIHTGTTQGTLQGADVLVRGGRIAAVGQGLAAAGVQAVDAQGKPVTPALFAGINAIGVEEVSGESSTVDSHIDLPQNQFGLRPEFDITLAYNPDSVLVPVARIEGFGWTMLSAQPGDSFIGGQGGAVRFDGSLDAIGPRVLFMTLGGGRAAQKAGGSRAAQWMILDQLIDEVRGRIPQDSQFAQLTPAGRATLAKYFGGGGRVAVEVHRAADIARLLRWSRERDVRIALVGASEGWKLAPQIAAAKVPVFVDPLVNLPGDFDQIGATMENAARLREAGVQVAFSLNGDASHSARKQRQIAGNAVAHGMRWDDALAALTRVPAEAFGLGGQMGSIAVGQRADLVLWSGDPLDVAHTATQVWLDGRAMPMRSRQTELRDRYLHPDNGLPRSYPAGGH
ncbi:amidohydrolase family protein [Thermomonas brevis]